MPTTGGFSYPKMSGSRLAKGLVSGALVLFIGSSSAEAFPFIKRKGNQQSIPPVTEVKPTMLQPSATPPKVSAPVAPLSPLQILINKGIFPPDAATRQQPISRAEWATVLVKAVGHNTSLVSEFPFYRDVPTD